MNRTEYLKLCQACAVRKKQHVPTELTVTYNGIAYIPRGYLLEFDKAGNASHTAVLHSRFANSETYAPLERVEDSG